MRFSWLENAYSRSIFRRAMLIRKLGQTDLVLVCHQGSLVGLWVHDYKSLCAAATICVTLVNMQTHRQTAF